MAAGRYWQPRTWLSGGDAQARRLEERVEKLQATLVRKDEVIAELLEYHVRLRKVLGRPERLLDPAGRAG